MFGCAVFSSHCHVTSHGDTNEEIYIIMSNMLFGINSTRRDEAKPSAISIALQVLLIPNSTGYQCYHSLIVGQQLLKKYFAIVATLYLSPIMSLFPSAGTFFSTYDSS